MSLKIKYIDVILPLPLKGTFTYSAHLNNLKIGQRVIVQFGVRKLYSALIRSIHNDKPNNYKAKPILAVLDKVPIVNIVQLKFWDWIADYYMCNLGDVMNAALPTSFKLASESKVIMHSNFDGDIDNLNSSEIKLLESLSINMELSLTQISKLVNVKNSFSFINDLIRREIVQIKENLHDKFKEKVIRVVKFIGNDNMLSAIKKTQKQDDFINAYLELVKKYNDKKWEVSDLLKEIKFSRSVLNTLVSKGFFCIDVETKSRLPKLAQDLIYFNELEDFQKVALRDIQKSFKTYDVCLLHGVTASGKTELYIKLIENELQLNKQVLYLLPEIALTTQIIKRLQRYFGDKVGVSHSHLNSSERVEVWNAVRENNNTLAKYPIMIGARSSLFLPFDNLGLIIVDEEHDSSFKQHQPAPRYQARDASIYLANLHQAKVLLGSATPSLESYNNVKIGKYALVEMHKRFRGIALPKVQIIDIRKSHLKKEMIYQFSPLMLNAIKETLELDKQVILFQNRRGYSTFISCTLCAHTPYCNNCDVSLTYHKWNDQLKCHYCGYSEKKPSHCTSCNGSEFIDKGFGTEQIEDTLNNLLPNYVTKRMDYDTTRQKNSHQQIITDFEEGKINILVGTQMVTKGLDFDNVLMVGILNADNMLHFPDFRSYERAFQLMMQVSGRAGRKGKQGQVLIQTYDEKNEIFKLLKNNDFMTFIKWQLDERKAFNYPPFFRIIGISLKNKNQIKLDASAQQLQKMLRKSFGTRILGPEYPSVSKIRNYFHKNIILKIEPHSSVSKAKIVLQTIIESMQNDSLHNSTSFIIDIDPY